MSKELQHTSPTGTSAAIGTGTVSSRARVTERRIIDALFELLKSDSIDRITVSEVCGKVGINRSTFYNHFTSLYEARDRCKAEVLSTVEKLLPQFIGDVMLGAGDTTPAMVEKDLGPQFEYIAVFLNGADPGFHEAVREIAKETILRILQLEELTEKQEYIFVGVVGMQLNIIGYWLSSGRKLSIDTLMKLVETMFQDGPIKTLMKELAAAPTA